MAIVVETGTGSATAESYVSVEQANTYFSLRGTVAWTGTEEVKEQALRKATDYLEQMYRDRWDGTRINGTQALSWPRVNAYRDGFLVSSNTVPPEVRIATAELALRSFTEPLLPDIDRITAPISSASLGELSVSYDTSQTGVVAGRKIFASVDHVLSPLLTSGVGGFKSVEVLRA
jgi:hypothetical protein